jgi:hypothetical protein
MEDNKTVFDLSTLAASDIAADDLFYITDLSEVETKKTSATNVKDYILSFSASLATGSFSGSFTGTFNGTSSYASQALTASYTLSSTGEINTASNTGSSLVNGRPTFGLFDSKIGYDLRFVKLASGTTGNIRLSENTSSKCIEIDAISMATVPGGTAGNVQYYDAAANTFGGDANFNWNKTTATLTISSGSANNIYIGSNVISASLISVTGSGVGLVGTASFSVSSSHAAIALNSVTASFAMAGNQISSSYATTASYISSGASGLSYITLVSSNALSIDNINGNHVTTLHGFGYTPPLLRSVLICTSTDAGFDVGDEIDIFSITDDTGGADDERLIATPWANSTTAGVNIGNSPHAFYVVASNASTSTYTAIDKTKWKVKVYIWR